MRAGESSINFPGQRSTEALRIDSCGAVRFQYKFGLNMSKLPACMERLEKTSSLLFLVGYTMINL
jgi:hypothetical protein